MSLRLFMMQHGGNKVLPPRRSRMETDIPLSDVSVSKPKLAWTNEVQTEVAFAKREAIERWENEGGDIFVSNIEIQPEEAARAAGPGS